MRDRNDNTLQEGDYVKLFAHPKTYGSERINWNSKMTKYIGKVSKIRCFDGDHLTLEDAYDSVEDRYWSWRPDSVEKQGLKVYNTILFNI